LPAGKRQQEKEKEEKRLIKDISFLALF